MTMPLTQPFVPETDFDLFLNEIGLDILPVADRDRIADQAREMAAYAVTRRIMERLTDEKIAELEKLMEAADQSGNHMPVNEFLLKEISDIETITDEAINEVKDALRRSLRNLPKAVEYAVKQHTEQIQRLAEEATRYNLRGPIKPSSPVPSPESEDTADKSSPEVTDTAPTSQARSETHPPVNPPHDALTAEPQAESDNAPTFPWETDSLTEDNFRPAEPENQIQTDTSAPKPDSQPVNSSSDSTSVSEDGIRAELDTLNQKDKSNNE